MAMSHIVKWGNSRGIRLPNYLLEGANLSEGDAVEMVVENDSIIIRKAFSKKHRTMEDRIAGFQGSYVFEEWNTSNDVGSEVLRNEDDSE